MDSKQQKDEGEKEFSIQPIDDKKGSDPKFAAHQTDRPVISQNLPEQEGSKDDREARKAELNKK